jgi:hypothetical protein
MKLHKAIVAILTTWTLLPIVTILFFLAELFRALAIFFLLITERIMKWCKP